MLNYPPGAHILAAMIGLLLGSTLNAMFLTGAIYAFGIYVVLGVLMQRAAGREFAAAALITIVLLLGAGATHQLSGNEIIENFYYAQLAGDCVMLVAFALLVGWTPKSPFTWLFSAAVAIAVVETFYVLSAVRLALALVLYQLPRVWRAQERNVKVCAVFVLMLPALVPLHPSFMSMVQNSAHDGTISVSMPSMLVSVALLLAVTLPIWMKQAIFGVKDDFALNCLGLGVALTAVVQIIAFFGLGLGSAYAIKKHAFLVGTLLVLVVALRISRLTRLSDVVGRLLGGQRLSGPAPTFAFAAIAVFLVFPWHSKPVAPFLRYDSEVRDLVSGMPDLQGSTISANKQFPLGLNLATSMAVVKMNVWSPVGLELFRLFGVETGSPTPSSQFILTPEADVGAGEKLDCKPEMHLRSVELVRSACFYGAAALQRNP